MTFSLVAYAQLALAETDTRGAAIALGAADGLNQRAGLRTWPSMRRDEADLTSNVAQAIDPDVFKEAFAAGSELTEPEAVALIRRATPSDSVNSLP